MVIVDTNNTLTLGGAWTRFPQFPLLTGNGTVSLLQGGRIGCSTTEVGASIQIRLGSYIGPVLATVNQSTTLFDFLCAPGVVYYCIGTAGAKLDYFTGYTSYVLANYASSLAIGQTYSFEGTGSNIETYSGFDYVIPGLSAMVTTNWASFAGDVANKLIAFNVRSYTNLWQGRPDATTKKARNMNIHKGPPSLGSTAGGAFNFNWVSFTFGNASATVFQRLDTGATINPATVFPAQAAFFNQFRDRFMGHFDATGSPVVAVEATINQISIWKSSLGTPFTFTGFSPIFLSSTEFVGLERSVSDTGNVVFYTKDTTGQTSNKFLRRGTTIFCRFEVDNYNVERTVVSALDIKFLMQTWFTGQRSYIMYNDANCGARTLESAAYQIITEENLTGTATPQSIGVVTTVAQTSTSDLNLQAEVALDAIIYASVVLPVVVAEAMSSIVSLDVLDYVLVVIAAIEADTNLQSAVDLDFLNYVFDPVVPPSPAAIITADAGTEQLTGAMTPQSILYV